MKFQFKHRNDKSVTQQTTPTTNADHTHAWLWGWNFTPAKKKSEHEKESSSGAEIRSFQEFTGKLKWKREFQSNPCREKKLAKVLCELIRNRYHIDLGRVTEVHREAADITQCKQWKQRKSDFGSTMRNVRTELFGKMIFCDPPSEISAHCHNEMH